MRAKHPEARITHNTAAMPNARKSEEAAWKFSCPAAASMLWVLALVYVALVFVLLTVTVLVPVLLMVVVVLVMLVVVAVLV
jgi:hypothetical protein